MNEPDLCFSCLGGIHLHGLNSCPNGFCKCWRGWEPAKEVETECEHDWLHLRQIPIRDVRATWGDEFYCRRCLAKREVQR